ncbi:MAG TPA: hypothetical protein VF507_07345 [Pyrinomonadaceae bacterium]|jgi:hypothetical protein
MKTHHILLLSALLAVSLFIGTSRAKPQVQQSGGTGNVTLQPGNNVVGKVGIDQTTPGTTNGVQVNGPLPSGSNTIGNVGVNGPLPSGTNTLGTVKIVPLNTCGSTAYDSGNVTLPSASTSLTAVATCVQRVYLNNTTSNPQSVTLTDAQATPQAYLSNFVIPANSTLNIELDGMKFVGGVKWQAGAVSSVTGQVIGNQ